MGLVVIIGSTPALHAGSSGSSPGGSIGGTVEFKYIYHKELIEDLDRKFKRFSAYALDTAGPREYYLFETDNNFGFPALKYLSLKYTEINMPLDRLSGKVNYWEISYDDYLKEFWAKDFFGTRHGHKT